LTSTAEQVVFYSDGHRLAGDLYLPSGGGRLPGVVLCHGWGGVKTSTLNTFGAAFAAQGIAALAFDYRGHGQSEGPRNRLRPAELAADARAAAAFLRAREGVDGAHVGALGILTGGAAALQAAADDPAIAAVVAFYPFGDGSRWLRSLRGYWEWKRLLQRIEADSRARATSGEGELLDPNEILPRDPEAWEGELRARQRSPDRAAWRLGLDSAAAIMAFRPELHAHLIAPRPVLVVAVEEDLMMPIDEVRALYARLGEPKRLISFRGIGHHEIYAADRLNPLLRDCAEFLKASGPR
jgi:alpha-beta hydrolase superfamily lysophospholipase